jgi:hypothetical protein
VHLSLPHPAPSPSSEAPEDFLGSSDLLDLQDSRLRLRAQALTQLCTTDREKALAIYRYVKKLPFERSFGVKSRTARKVMDLGRGDGGDKSILLVALLRRVGIPARIRLIELRGEVLRGFNTNRATMIRPFVEIWLHGRWVRTDTHIFDVGYVAAARQRLKDHDWEWGYGTFPTESDPMVIASLGVLPDTSTQRGAGALLHRIRAWWGALSRNMLTFSTRKVVRKLQQEGSPGSARSGPWSRKW